MSISNDLELIYSLIGYPNETEWIEFKENYSEANQEARDISALANSAAYHERPFAYKIWGVRDTDHALTGTDFRPYKTKAKGNQDFHIWLRQFLTTNCNYEFEEIDANDKHFVVLKIYAASNQPICFSEQAYIREGSSTTKLKAGSEKEAELWRRLQQSSFERGIAEDELTLDEAMDRLDIDAFFSMQNLRPPASNEDVGRALIRQDILIPRDDGRFAISNLGALTIAREMSIFPGLRKRQLRIVRFDGPGRTSIIDDRFFDMGYALAIPKAVDYLMSVLPAHEILDGAFRKVCSQFPQSAVRELLSNTVIHQDLNSATSSPEVHLFANRLEFTNPGSILVPQDRILNAQSKTRNAELVRLLRQMDLCEEEGTGWDIIIEACEENQLYAPRIKSDPETGTEVTLFGEAAFDRMTKAERKEAAYWHACLMYSQDSALTNLSLRHRFGLDDAPKNGVAISRLIRECCDEGLLREEDPDAGRKSMRYIPSWA